MGPRVRSDSERLKDAEYRATNRDAIRAANHRYRLANKERISVTRKIKWAAMDEVAKEAHKARSKASRDKRFAKRQEYTKKYAAENSERMKEWRKAWRRNNPDAVRAIGKRSNDKRKAQNALLKSAWKKKNPDRVRSWEAKRRAIKRSSPKVERVDYPAIYARDGGICHICGGKPEKYHFDHVIPLSKGGSHVPENIKVSCASCNMQKHNKIYV